MKWSGALVVFVKTPGLSPIKTRLAQSLGAELAQEFYERSVRATEALARVALKQCSGLAVYWAVAEMEGLGAEIWSGFPTIYQGEGSLGLRLSNVYQQILRRHEFACFIGADSPHLEVSRLLHGIRETANGVGRQFTLGESDDGGFYFFGGSIPVPEIDWTSINYSVPQTAQELTARLRHHGSVTKIASDFDIDTVDELRRYSDERLMTPELLPEQVEVIRWARTVLKEDIPERTGN